MFVKSCLYFGFEIIILFYFFFLAIYPDVVNVLINHFKASSVYFLEIIQYIFPIKSILL